MNRDGLLPCARECIQTHKLCTKQECRHWIEFGEDKNCCLVAVYEHGSMTLREVAERLGISFARVKQIETGALRKIKKRGTILELFF